MGYKGCTNCGKTMKTDGSPCPACGLTDEQAAVHSAAAKWLCTSCGAQTNPVTHTKGSFVIEVVLWFLMILPGVLYTVWRITSREQVCPACRKPTLIPIDSPVARATLAQLER